MMRLYGGGSLRRLQKIGDNPLRKRGKTVQNIFVPFFKSIDVRRTKTKKVWTNRPVHTPTKNPSPLNLTRRWLGWEDSKFAPSCQNAIFSVSSRNSKPLCTVCAHLTPLPPCWLNPYWNLRIVDKRGVYQSSYANDGDSVNLGSGPVPFGILASNPAPPPPSHFCKRSWNFDANAGRPRLSV